MKQITLATLFAISASTAAYALPSPDMLSQQQAATANMQAQQQMAQQPFAQPVDGEGWGAIPALPLEVMQSGDVHFINGGVSDEELSQLKSTAGQYNLQILVSGPGGEYVGDVNITVRNSAGAAVLNVADAGPYLYVALKPGTYTLDVSGAGNQHMKVNVPANGAVKKNISVAG